MKKIQIQKMVFSAFFCALIFAATWIHIPTPPVGNVNLGDGVLLLTAWILGGPWAVAAAMVGGGLADLSAGFVLYAPGTALIKAAMVGMAILVRRLTANRNVRVSCLLSALAAELLMILGYFVYEFLILGLLCGMEGYCVGAIANLLFNAVQGALAVVLACIIGARFERRRKE